MPAQRARPPAPAWILAGLALTLGAAPAVAGWTLRVGGAPVLGWAALGVTVAGALVAAFGWGLLNATRPPAWTSGTLLGAALVGATVASGCLALAHGHVARVLPTAVGIAWIAWPRPPRSWIGLPIVAVGALVPWLLRAPLGAGAAAAASGLAAAGTVRWAGRGLPRGYAPGVVGLGRCLLLAAVGLWAATLVVQPRAILTLSNWGLGTAIGLGAIALGAAPVAYLSAAGRMRMPWLLASAPLLVGLAAAGRDSALVATLGGWLVITGIWTMRAVQAPTGGTPPPGQAR